MAKKETIEVPIAEYVHLNKRGFPCSKSWKWRLVKKEQSTGEKAPFEWVAKYNSIYVITEKN